MIIIIQKAVANYYTAWQRAFKNPSDTKILLS